MKKEAYRHFAEKLKTLREQADYSMDAFCEAFNKKYDASLNKSTISRYENMAQEPMLSTVKNIADFFGVSFAYFIGWEDEPQEKQSPRKGVKIPVLGTIAAGVPIEAIEEIIDWEEITPELAATGDFFALQVKGESMTPRICNGDVVIVKKQTFVESGDVAIVLINGDDATVKQIIIKQEGIALQAFNPSVYETHFYTNKEIKNLPVTILGKVIELRGKFQ